MINGMNMEQFKYKECLDEVPCIFSLMEPISDEVEAYIISLLDNMVIWSELVQVQRDD